MDLYGHEELAHKSNDINPEPGQLVSLADPRSLPINCTRFVSAIIGEIIRGNSSSSPFDN